MTGAGTADVTPPTPGPGNAVTDVPGVLVGHHHRLDAGWATGCTVLLTPEGVTAGVDVRGGAPGTRETDLLAPGRLVERVNAICLAGGSAYGLAAADGVMRWLGARGHGFRVGPERGNTGGAVDGPVPNVVPIVPAAVLFDLEETAWGRVPDAGFGHHACEDASGEPPATGSVGAGAGAAAGSLRGGVGTASVLLPTGWTVGALTVANPAGEVVDPATGLPFGWPLGFPGEFGLVPPSADEIRRAAARRAPARSLNTLIGAVATDADLTRAECGRVAAVAHDGIARSVRPAHSVFDGDTLFTLATGRRPLPTGPARTALVDELAQAAADVVARAVVHAVLAAAPGGVVPSYRELYPSALG
ncbi:P1 family peptidase [Actinoalloteichus caeruleus]|uniref:P1 family peptidase n=1 Tax=Actinoalloteichus cyanogriseus TaxID=2893586 RepID=UPI0004AB0D60|nr:P1 family peptidase [Actinoalloteichus caeruleus]